MEGRIGLAVHAADSPRHWQAILGAANYATAAICKLTNNQPSSVCTSTIQSLDP
jgi:hypothetical protein